MPLDILVPVLMGVALLWFIGRGVSWSSRLTVAAITLVLVIVVVVVERSGWLQSP